MSWNRADTLGQIACHYAPIPSVPVVASFPWSADSAVGKNGDAPIYLRTRSWLAFDALRRLATNRRFQEPTISPLPTFGPIQLGSPRGSQVSKRCIFSHSLHDSR